MGLLAWTVFVAGLAACGGDPTAPVADASTDATHDAGGPVASAPPELPRFPACPPGFRATEVLPGISGCDPAPADPVTACPPGSLRVFGDGSCTSVSRPCDSRFPSELPTDGETVFVDASAPDGGDGTEGAPFNSLRNSLAVAPTGGVIAVAAGRYAGPLSIRRPVSILGACADEVIVVADAAADAISVQSVPFDIREVTVEGGRLGVAASGARAAVTMEAVVVRASVAVGVLISEGVLTMRRVVIEDTAGVSAAFDGRCLAAQAGATATLDTVSLTGCDTSGVTVTGDAAVVARDLTIEDVAPGPVNAGQAATVVAARLSIERGWIRNAVLSGVSGFEGAVVAFTDVLIEDIEGGAFEFDASELTTSRVITRRTASTAFNLKRSLATQIEDTIVDRVAPVAGGYSGGIEMEEGRVALRRVAISGAERIGLLARDVTLEAEDLTVQDIVGNDVGSGFGRGIALYDGVTTLRRVRVRRVREHGLVIVGDTTIEDLDVAEVTSDNTGHFGHGLHVEGPDTEVEAVRVSVSGVRGAGLVALYGASVAASELSVRDVEASACVASGCTDAAAGSGIVLGEGGGATFERFLLSDNALAGAQFSNAELDWSEGVVRGHVIGVAVGVDGYRLERLQDGVRYEDNEVNLDSQSLPVPSAQLSVED